MNPYINRGSRHKKKKKKWWSTVRRTCFSIVVQTFQESLLISFHICWYDHLILLCQIAFRVICCLSVITSQVCSGSCQIIYPCVLILTPIASSQHCTLGLSHTWCNSSWVPHSITFSLNVNTNVMQMLQEHQIIWFCCEILNKH